MLKKLFDYIFHQADPIPKLVTDDHATVAINVIGDCGVFVFFLIFAAMCFILSKNATPKEAYLQRRRLTNMLGTAIMFCALSRGLNVLAYYHNYYFLNGIFKCLAFIFAMATLLYIPYLLKAIKNARTLDQVHKDMKNTDEKVQQLQEITEKIIERKN